MKVPQFYVTVALGAICLVLSIVSLLLSKSNQTLQAQYQAQQDEINRGNATLQVGQNVLRDMAELSVKNDKIKEVLKNNGYNVTVNASATPSPSPAK